VALLKVPSDHAEAVSICTSLSIAPGGFFTRAGRVEGAVVGRGSVEIGTVTP
jgi:hypothetical protein